MGLLVSPELTPTAAHVVATVVQRALECSGTIAPASSSASWLSVKWPAAEKALARASRSSTRWSTGALEQLQRRTAAGSTRARGVPSRRHHAGRHSFYVAPARRPLDVVGARRRCRPHRERLRTARGPRAASRPRWPRRQRAGRAGGGSGTVEARRSSESDRRAGARRLRPSPQPQMWRPRRPPVQARTDRRPPPLLRARGVRRPTAREPSLSDAATAAGTSRPVGKALERRCVLRGQPTGRAARGTRGCHRTPRRGRCAKGVDPVAEKLEPHPA